MAKEQIVVSDSLKFIFNSVLIFTPDWTRVLDGYFNGNELSC